MSSICSLITGDIRYWLWLRVLIEMEILGNSKVLIVNVSFWKNRVITTWHSWMCFQFFIMTSSKVERLLILFILLSNLIERVRSILITYTLSKAWLVNLSRMMMSNKIPLIIITLVIQLRRLLIVLKILALHIWILE